MNLAEEYAIIYGHKFQKGYKFVADVKKKGFKTIETNYEELEGQIWDHRKQLLKRAVQIIGLVVVLVVGINLIYA